VPTRLTKGLSVVSANNGVDVSFGRVTKAFEVIPSMATPVASTKLTKVGGRLGAVVGCLRVLWVGGCL